MRDHTKRASSLAVVGACAALLAACATTTGSSAGDAGSDPSPNRSALNAGLDYSANPDPFPSTYRGKDPAS
jgi:hypothetical protein